MILIVFLSIRFSYHKNIIQLPEQGISMTEIENSGYGYDLDESLLVEVFDNQNDNSLKSKDNEDYIQYLLDNDIDLTLLEKQL